jgi:hypothetical protein
VNISIHKQSLEAALAEVRELIKERDELDRKVDGLNLKIADLVAAIDGLAPLCGINARTEYPSLFPYEVEPEIGFTDAIRKIFSVVPARAYTAVGVRDELVKSGFDLDKYTNPMASIHTILKRLVATHDVDAFDEEGRTVYVLSPTAILRQRLKRAKKTTKGKK